MVLLDLVEGFYHFYYRGYIRVINPTNLHSLSFSDSLLSKQLNASSHKSDVRDKFKPDIVQYLVFITRKEVLMMLEPLTLGIQVTRVPSSD